jgi:hypothetical protein
MSKEKEYSDKDAQERFEKTLRGGLTAYTPSTSVFPNPPPANSSGSASLTASA